MSPSVTSHITADDLFDDGLNLSIVGLGVQYPPYRVGPDALETLARRYYPDSNALDKVLSINRYTGIETRAVVGNVDDPIINQPNAPSIRDLNNLFMREGVKLSISACKQAIEEWGGCVDEITHVVSTTCTNSANPGFDHYVLKSLGIRSNVEKVLLHGVGCSGGLAAIRTAATLALGLSYRRRPARVLILACELCSVLVRSELDSIAQDQEVRIGVCLFSDCASACIASNGIGDKPSTQPVYELLAWKHDVLEDTEKDLGFDVDPSGWKVVLSPRVPSITSASVSSAFQDLINSLPAIHKSKIPINAANFDWALHPGGSTVITGVEQAMNLTPEHLRASYEIYMKYGNSSSATIMSVMNQLRNLEGGREDVVVCAFGPGITLEMMILKRNNLHEMPPAEDVD